MATLRGERRKRVLEWIEALESGEWDQTTSKLCAGDGGSFCCLGVACELATDAVGGAWTEITHRSFMLYVLGDAHLGEASTMPEIVADHYGMDTDPRVAWSAFEAVCPDVAARFRRQTQGEAPQDVYLTSLNDHHQLTFEQIAKVLRTHYRLPR